MTYFTTTLQRENPLQAWGFTVVGGFDCNLTPLVVEKVRLFIILIRWCLMMWLVWCVCDVLIVLIVEQWTSSELVSLFLLV